MTQKRNIFAELVEGFDTLKQQREGKRTLCSVKARSKHAPNQHPSRPASR
jgi:hypothetical protein